MITSLTNEKIKEINKLKEGKEQRKAQKFLVEGPHLVNEAKALGLLEMSVTSNPKYEGLLVSKEVMKKLSSTVSPVEVIGVCKFLKPQSLTNRILLLDGIQDPTNLGTLLRTAKAFGFDTVFSSNETVSYYNDKVIRGSQGAIFKLNLLKGDLKEFILKIQNDYLVYGTNVRIGEDVTKVRKPSKFALILGNEGKGVSEEVEALAHKNLYIPLKNMESLNVSIAGAILMYELNK